MRKIRYIVVHCSDTPNDRDVDAATIHEWHKERGFDGIGYHFVIRRDGTIENGRPIYWKGAHAKKVNHNSIGICLVGRDVFTTEQLASLELEIRRQLADRPHLRVKGHYQFDDHKTCPNFDAEQWWLNIKSKRC